MKFLVALFLFPCLVMAAPGTGKVRVCFSPYREELVTADLLLANSMGFFKEEGLEPEFLITESVKREEVAHSLLNRDKGELYPIGTWVDVSNVRKASSGDCDITSTALENLFLAKVDAKSIRPIAMYLYGKNYDTHLLVRSASKAASVKDLKGKTIRVGQIGTRLVLAHILKDSGMTLNDVKLAQVSPDEILPAFKSGKYEASIAYNPTTPLLLASNEARILTKNIYSSYMSPFVPHSMLIASSGFEKNRPEVFAKFMKAFRKSATYIRKNPVSTVDMLASGGKKKALAFKYEQFSPVTVQKSAAFFNISEPYYLGEPSEQFTRADVRTAILQFHDELVTTGFLAAAVDLKSLDDSFQLNGH